METSAPGVRLHLIGRFELWVDGRRAIDKTWPRAKAKSLLKLLALQFGGTMHRDQVVDVLWPDLQSDAAGNNLHKTLHHLRQATGVDSVVFVREGMVSLCNEVWIDVHAFVNGCLGTRETRSIDGLRTALALYRGELLPDDPYEPWTERHRDNLRSLFVSCALDLSGLLEDRGEYREAIEWASAAVQQDASTEAAHARLMRLFVRTGSPALALRQYERCRTILRRELDVEPSDRLTALRDQIRRESAGAIAPEREEESTDEADDLPPPITHSLTRDGASVASWALASGDAVPVVSMPWLPHNDIRREWSIPAWRAQHRRMSAHRELVRYDARGTGASLRQDVNFSIDALVADLEAVTESRDLRRFALWASFHSGAAAIAYATRHPEQVSHLILWCCYLRGTDLRRQDELASLRRLLSADWRVYSESAAQFFFAWEHQRTARAYAALIREAGGPEEARAFLPATAEYDASEIASQLRVPTLVMHRRTMPWLNLSYANELAAAIPGATLRIVDGSVAAPFLEGAREIETAITDFIDDRA